MGKGMIGRAERHGRNPLSQQQIFELNMRMPLQFRDKELELRAELSKQLERGKADLNISFDNNDLAKRSSVNKEIFNAYFEELSALGKEYHLSDVNLFDLILRMPGRDEYGTFRGRWDTMEGVKSAPFAGHWTFQWFFVTMKE